MDAAFTHLCDNSHNTAKSTCLYTHKKEQDNPSHFCVCKKESLKNVLGKVQVTGWVYHGKSPAHRRAII